MITKEKLIDWQLTSAEVFWGEIAPCDHVLQIYNDQGEFLDMLAGFTGNGINAGESVVVIATSMHLDGLNTRLKAHGINTESLIQNDQYIPLNAEESLAQFMVNGWPDEDKFMDFVSETVKRSRNNNRRVRAFGEMVALLWEQGHYGATVHLEHLWNKFCSYESLCLFCAYPRSGFTADPEHSLKHICQSHTKMIEASDKPLTQIYYKPTASVVNSEW